ncbi:MAG TPA: hypothetical protein PKJ16_03095 [Spirochaetota bacterium]|nr:hypothetical protein [Spirochaetota bacterium]HPU89569.1 hypothetical protein [Spirochaetota bacterium]
MRVHLFDMDSLESRGMIVADDHHRWEYRDVANEHLVRTTSGLPLRAVLACLSSFNIVYDIVED